MLVTTASRMGAVPVIGNVSSSVLICSSKVWINYDFGNNIELYAAIIIQVKRCSLVVIKTLSDSNIHIVQFLYWLWFVDSSCQETQLSKSM